MWSSMLKEKHKVSENLFHITDWLPTLYTAAGNNHIIQISSAIDRYVCVLI